MRSINFLSVKETLEYVRADSKKGYVLHTSVEKVIELSKSVDSNVVLCSTAGEYTPQGYKEGVITGFEYDLNEGNIVEILSPPVKSLYELTSAYEKVKSNKNAFMLLLCDGLSGGEERIISTFYFMDDDFKIIGGSAGDDCAFKETLIYIGSKKVNSVAIFFDIKRKTTVIKENVYEKSGRRMLVTDADTINRTVKTFNNRPASTEYANMLGIKESELPKYFENNPLGKMYKDDIYIASPMKVNSDKSITFYSQMIPNTFVEILEPIDAIKKVEETVKNIGFRPQFTYVVHCILRSSKFKRECIWSEFDKELIKLCNNTTGFVSYGEQCYKHHVNQTMVLLAVE